MAEAAINQNLKSEKHQLVPRLLRTYIAITMPFLLALISIRFVMSPIFLGFEYNRADFPEDFYGFSQADRLSYAPYALEYLLNSADIDFLGDLRFPDGTSMYNSRELHHMRDVKVVTQYAYLGAFIGGVAAILAAIYLYQTNRSMLRRALFSGAVFTLSIIATIIVIAVINWDFFFTGFHNIFFASGTWRFEYSDTLIRLFPEQFWFDAALTIGGLTVSGSVLILIIAWNWGRTESNLNS